MRRTRYSIAVTTPKDDSCQLVRPQVALDTGSHLSYPFVFERDGEIYMIPESRVTREVVVHRAVDFPLRWERHATLLEGVNVGDPTLVEHAGRFWLFVNSAVEGATSSDELSIYVADYPFGPYRPHASNPVVSDVRRARPAGRVLEIEGALIRPAQDSERGYGARVVFQRITRLDEIGYSEEEVGSIEGDWLADNLGTHTYDRDQRFEVIDGHRRVARWRRKS